jgi:hypothetical protein
MRRVMCRARRRTFGSRCLVKHLGPQAFFPTLRKSVEIGVGEPLSFGVTYEPMPSQWATGVAGADHQL